MTTLYTISPMSIKLSSTPYRQIQSNFTSMLPKYPITKIAKMILPQWRKWLQELKTEKKTTLKYNFSCINEPISVIL